MVVISSLLTCLFLQKKKLQAISTDILDSFNNLNEKKKKIRERGRVMAFGANARIVTSHKGKDKPSVEFVKIANFSHSHLM